MLVVAQLPHGEAIVQMEIFCGAFIEGPAASALQIPSLDRLTQLAIKDHRSDKALAALAKITKTDSAAAA